MNTDMLRRCAVSAVFLGLWAFYLANLSPSVGVGDSGEFITGAATLSLPHAPSYPFFNLMGKAFHSAVCFGNSAYRLNLMSAFFCLMSAVLIFLMARRMGLSEMSGLMAALLAAAAPAFFHNGLVTEVFALNTFLALAAFGAALLPWPRGGILSSFILGLGMGNHQTILFAAPGIAVLWWRSWKKDQSNEDWPRVLPWIVLAFAAGLSVYGYLPARSPQNPPLDWGNPENLNGVLRSFFRKDYGTLSLALGEQPARGISSGVQQMARYFGDGLLKQFSWAGIGVILLGFWMAWRRERTLAVALGTALFFSGPFFIWLGNMPFDAQSTGVLERFYILAAMFAAIGAGFLFENIWSRWKWAACLLFVLPVFVAMRSAETYPLRNDFLAQDYVRSVFRSLPPNAAFFMDGGDDTFFGTAFQRFVQRQRPDINLFDRGGLIFASAYGPDFRSLDKTSKEARRQWAEQLWMAKGPLVYSTMNEKILNDTPVGQTGFLFRAGSAQSNDAFWDMYVLRSLYPPASSDYRTHALAPYFPFLRARSLWKQGRFDDALKYLDRAWTLGPGVPWLRNNITAELLEFAYGRLQAGDWAMAENISRRCLAIDPSNVTALCNLGVTAEKRERLEEAAEWYQRAMSLAPGRVDVIFNLSVVRWRQGAWNQVVLLLEQVLRLQPDHAAARQYLPQAKHKLAQNVR